MRGGAAHRSMWLLWEIGAMSILLPELAAFIDDEAATDGGGKRFWNKLDAIDRRTKELGHPLDDVTLWTTLLHEPLEEASAGSRDRIQATFEFLEPIIERIAMPRRIADAVRRIVAMIPRLSMGKAGRLARTELIGPATEVLEFERIARGQSLDVVERLREEISAAGPPIVPVRPGRPGRWSRGGRSRRPR